MINNLNIKYNLLIIITIICFFSLPNRIKASNQTNYDNKEEVLDLSPSLLIYEDKDGTLEFNDIITKEFISITQGVPNLEISESTFWVKLNILNNSSEEQLILMLSSPTIDSIKFYHPTLTDEYETIYAGEAYPFNFRKYKDPYYLFDISLPKNTNKTFYIKISSKDGIQLPIKLGTKNAIYSNIKNRDILSGIYLGIMLVMILYNLFVFFSVKDKSYIYYVVYIFSVLMAQTILQGYTFQYLWPYSPAFSQYSIYIFPSLAGITGIIFMSVFLKVNSYNHLFFKISIILSAIYIIPLVLGLLGDHSLGYLILSINAGIVSLYILITSIIVLKKGYQPAKYFLAAWVIFLIGVIIFILKDVGVLPYNTYTRYTMQFGSAIETILLSFALAARINLYKKEKEASQLQTLEALKENEKIVREQNIILEQKVDERTRELKETLNHLKSAQSKLVDSEKMSSLGQLTAGIAHEINNPINFVSSNISPLRQDIEDIKIIIDKHEELKSCDNIEVKLQEIEELKKELDFDYLKTELKIIIDGIEDGAVRTKQIVSGLKNFSRLDEGEAKEADINEGIESTLILLNSKLNKIELTKNLQNLPLIYCYPGKLNQLFMNIIDNAIQAIEEQPEKGLLTIASTHNDTSVIISIKDNGAGMNNETKEKIFEPFFTTKDVGKGTGLGLSIAYNIIKAHEGEIKVKSELGKGTEFIIKLPITCNNG